MPKTSNKKWWDEKKRLMDKNKRRNERRRVSREQAKRIYGSAMTNNDVHTYRKRNGYYGKKEAESND